ASMRSGRMNWKSVISTETAVFGTSPGSDGISPVTVRVGGMAPRSLRSSTYQGPGGSVTTIPDVVSPGNAGSPPAQTAFRYGTRASVPPTPRAAAATAPMDSPAASPAGATTRATPRGVAAGSRARPAASARGAPGP